MSNVAVPLTEKPEAKSAPEILVWNLGLEAPALSAIASIFSKVVVKEIAYDLEKLSEAEGPNPEIIVCGPVPEGISITEVAQMLRMQYANTPIYLAAFTREGYDRKTFIKNGFTDAFIFPLDIDLAKKELSAHITRLSAGKIKSFRPVKLLDIQAGEVLGFDTTLYLPANKRYIKYSSAGAPLNEERMKKLANANMNSLYVSTDQMKEFYKYTATRLKNTATNESLSATERQEKMEDSIRQITSGLFNQNSKEASFEDGRALMEDLREITNTFICSTPGNDWYAKLSSTIGAISSSYSHAANVSTYAALFSAGLGIGKPAELATAALLHDIGLADIPHEIASKPEELHTPEERVIYQRHPELSIAIIKAKRMILPENVIAIIEQHHECFNGSGFPKAYVGSRISKEAQVLSLADRFDELTSAKEGRKLLSPTEALQYFRDQMKVDASKMIFDPALLTALLKLFPA